MCIRDSGYGDHRIEGIGDKHVPWIHNCKNTDLIIGVDDEVIMRLLRLFNESAGRDCLISYGVDSDFVNQLDKKSAMDCMQYAYDNGVNFFDNAGFNDLAKLNINSGKVTHITGSPVIYPSWVLNGKGDLMGVWTSDLENRAEIYLYKPNLPEGSLESRECKTTNCYIPILKKDNKKPGWVFFKDFDFPYSASIESFSDNGKMIVVENMEHDTTGLYEYDLKDNSYELLYRNPNVDITGVASSRDEGTYGIRIDNGKPEYLYLSEPNKLKDLALKLVFTPIFIESKEYSISGRPTKSNFFFFYHFLLLLD